MSVRNRHQPWFRTAHELPAWDADWGKPAEWYAAEPPPAWAPVLLWGQRVPRKLKKRIRGYSWRPVYRGHASCYAPGR